MKTHYILRIHKATFIIAALTLLLTACQKEETDPFNIPKGALMLTTEGFSSQEGGSKTSVNGTAVHWVNGDRIRINGTTGYVYTGTGTNANKAYATGDWNISSAVRAFYPADIVDQQYWNSDYPVVNFPNRFASSFDASGHQIIGLPMVGRAGANAEGVKFRHLSAAINVRVRNNTGRAKLYLDSITVSSASQQLCGLALVTLGSNLTITGTGLTANNMSVTVYFPNSESNYLANGEIRDVQVPIYPTVAGELTFKVYCHTRADEEIHVGLCPAHIEYNYCRTLSNGTLNRNVMATAQIAITDDGYTARIDHGLFTASNGRQVRFSQGNLLCHRGGGDYWYMVDWFSFQTHQYTPHPEHHLSNGKGQNVGQNYSDDASNDWNIGLFGWGSSCYVHTYGWSFSPSNTEDGTDYYKAYGNLSRSLFEPDYGNPAIADWGYNPITNGGNTENAGWYTPSKEDWQTIVFTRPASTVALHDFWGNASGTCANARYVRAQVENSSRQPVKGLILFPDNFVDPFGPDGYHAMQFVNNTTDHTNWNEVNVYYSNEDWFRMEAAGAVFLPTASWRCGRKVDGFVTFSNGGEQVNEYEGVSSYPHRYADGLSESFYWSSTADPKDTDKEAWGFAFGVGHPVEIVKSRRYIGHPVRLIFADNGHGRWSANGLEGYGDQGNAW